LSSKSDSSSVVIQLSSLSSNLTSSSSSLANEAIAAFDEMLKIVGLKFCFVNILIFFFLKKR
jgi:hypothetical protein